MHNWQSKSGHGKCEHIPNFGVAAEWHRHSCPPSVTTQTLPTQLVGAIFRWVSQISGPSQRGKIYRAYVVQSFCWQTCGNLNNDLGALEFREDLPCDVESKLMYCIYYFSWTVHICCNALEVVSIPRRMTWQLHDKTEQHVQKRHSTTEQATLLKILDLEPWTSFHLYKSLISPSVMFLSVMFPNCLWKWTVSIPTGATSKIALGIHGGGTEQHLDVHCREVQQLEASGVEEVMHLEQVATNGESKATNNSDFSLLCSHLKFLQYLN